MYNWMETSNGKFKECEDTNNDKEKNRMFL